jgi:hypothetical protein
MREAASQAFAEVNRAFTAQTSAAGFACADRFSVDVVKTSHNN